MPDRDVNVVITRLSGLSEDVNELKDTLKQIASAVTRLALVEERQMQTNEALSRAFKGMDKIDTRLSVTEHRVVALERDVPLQKQASGWVMSAVWAAAGLAAFLILRTIGIGL